MKRRFIKQRTRLEYVPANIPESLREYADRLRLLNDIPLTYLFSDVSDLSEESIRFAMLDINWTDALLDGAFSIGRICNEDSISDKCAVRAVSKSKGLHEMPRAKKMHSNHKKPLSFYAEVQEDYSVVSTVVIRSQLVKLIKGLNMYGYDENNKTLEILRMETISEGILICLFHGRLDKIIIAEPKTGLKFGSSIVDWSDNKITRSIDLRSALDNADLGKRINSLCIDEFTDYNGRIHSKKLAENVGNQLKDLGKLGEDKITPSRFAFEMIAAAHRAEFCAFGNSVTGKED